MARSVSSLIDKRKLSGRAHYRMTAVSGLITGVVAGTATAGHLFVFRNPSSSVLLYVTRARFGWYTTTGFTAAQEMALELFRASSYSAAHTGGTAVTAQKRKTSYAASAATARIATTGELTAGTHTLGSQPLLRRGVVELADGAAVVKRTFDLDWIPRDDHPEALAQNEGLILRNAVAMGAAGVGRLVAEIDYFER
jgi:hypothetical protein